MSVVLPRWSVGALYPRYRSIRICDVLMSASGSGLGLSSLSPSLRPAGGAGPLCSRNYRRSQFAASQQRMADALLAEDPERFLAEWPEDLMDPDLWYHSPEDAATGDIPPTLLHHHTGHPSDTLAPKCRCPSATISKSPPA